MRLQASVFGVLIGALLSPSLVQAQTYSKTETIEYHDDLSLWVLGQVKRTTTNGIETSRTEYAWKASPTKTYAFGKFQQTIGYNTSDGTISHVVDGKNNLTIFRSWMRGIPRQIESADGNSQYAIVNDSGWITSVTEENGYKTCYGYDAMGRLANVTYPSETAAGVCDTSKWAATTQVFQPVLSAEYGIPAGHWRQTVSTGNARKVTYFDALWRPLIVREYDNANVAATQRFSRFAYDHEGRVAFASYPGTTDALSSGTWTEYDALGRVTSVSQDSELSPSLLTTTTVYSSDARGPLTRVTSPKGQQTRTWYQMFDQPSYDAPVRIEHPEGVVTEIPRDVFGKPQSTTRSGTGG